MRRQPDRSVTAVAATRPRVSRPLVLAAALVVLALALAVFVFARTAATRHAAAPETPATVVATADQASEPWFLAEPTAQKVGRATDRPARTKAAAPEPDWSAFSLGVSDAQAAVVMPQTSTDAASPAELVVAMSKQERGRLMAAAREAESGPAPAGYRPAIGRHYPAGSGDGICR